MRLRVTMAFLGALLSVQSYAEVTFGTLDKSVAFTVEGMDFHYGGYQRFVSIISDRSKQPVDDTLFLQGVLENRLLTLSLSEVVEEEGHHHHDDGHGHAEVLFADIFQEYQQILASLAPSPTAKDERRSVLSMVKSDELLRLLSGFSGLTRTKKMAREAFSEEQKAKAKEIVIGRYSIPNHGEQQVSYWDVYQIQSIQHKAKVRRGDYQQITQGIREYVAIKLHEHKVKASLGLEDADLATIWQMVSDKISKQQYFLETGIVMDLHHDQPRLAEFKATVTDAEVNAYYEKNKADYVQVGSVTARHITVRSQDEADKVRQELDDGLDFAEAIRRYSIAKDDGHLGFINRKDKNLSFVKKLALIQAVGKVSTPYRMLDGLSYEIILVDKKQPEPLPVTDKSVRNDILNTLGVRKAKEALEANYRRWFAEKNIAINSHYFPASRYQAVIQ